MAIIVICSNCKMGAKPGEAIDHSPNCYPEDRHPTVYDDLLKNLLRAAAVHVNIRADSTHCPEATELAQEIKEYLK